MSGRTHSYLIRLAEAGREAQTGHRKLRRDVAAAIARSLPGSRMRTDVGRIFLETQEDASSALAEVHGITSFSPCVQCALEEIEDVTLAFARPRLRQDVTYRVKVKRVGEHTFDSTQMAARLGARIGEELPGAVVSLDDPAVTLGVEIRNRDCYVFDRLVPGVDRRGPVREPIAGEPRFVVDQMLGTLVPWLRLLGFDSKYVCDEPDTVLLRMAREEARIILTRDLELSRSRSVPVLFVEASEPDLQLVEIVETLKLRILRSRLFTRCTLCNGEVRTVEKAAVRDRIPEVAYRLYEEFTTCDACDKIYWRGGQYERILSRLEGMLEE